MQFFLYGWTDWWIKNTLITQSRISVQIDYFVTYRQVMLGYLEMPISQKPKYVLHITDVQIENFTILRHNLGKTN